MHPKRLLMVVGALVALLVGFRGASAFMIAGAVAPPGASAASVLGLLAHPRFQMATPHRNLFTEVKLRLSPPTVCASGIVDCDGEESLAGCGDCTPGYCHCPGCTFDGPCTPSYCTYVGGNHFCVYHISTVSPCVGCEADRNQSCKSRP